MPLSVYVTRNRPPTGRDHLLAHSFGVPWGAVNIVLAALLPLAEWGPWSMSQTVTWAPWWAVLVAVAFHVLGGLKVLMGIYDVDTEDATEGWARERLGLGILAVVWVAWFTVLIFHPGTMLLSLLIMWAIASSVTRIQAINAREREIRRGLTGRS